MRKRKNNIFIKLNDYEYSLLKDKQKRCGVSITEFISKTIQGINIIDLDSITELKTLNINLSKFIEQVRRIGININQLSIIANKNGYIPTNNQLDEIRTELQSLKIEVIRQWQFIKQLTQKLQ